MIKLVPYLNSNMNSRMVFNYATRAKFVKNYSILTIVRLILLTGLLSLFFACSSTSSVDKPASLQEFKEKEGDSKTSNATEAYWAIPEQYKNVSIEQIKSQIEITDYMVMKGAATNAATEDMDGFSSQVNIKGTGKSIGATTGAFAKDPPKNVKDRAALAQYTNKLISLEGVVNTIGTQSKAPLAITEQIPGKYEVWFCADKNQKRRPCRYRAYLLYEAPEGKGNTLFTHDNVIRFWGVVLEEQIGILRLPQGRNYKRFPKIRVLDLEVIK